MNNLILPASGCGRSIASTSLAPVISNAIYDAVGAHGVVVKCLQHTLKLSSLTPDWLTGAAVERVELLLNDKTRQMTPLRQMSDSINYRST